MDANTVLSEIISLAELAYDAANEMNLDELEAIKDEMLRALKKISNIVLTEQDKPQIEKALETYDTICSVLEGNQLKHREQIANIQNGIQANRAYLSNQKQSF